MLDRIVNKDLILKKFLARFKGMPGEPVAYDYEFNFYLVIFIIITFILFLYFFLLPMIGSSNN